MANEGLKRQFVKVGSSCQALKKLYGSSLESVEKTQSFIDLFFPLFLFVAAHDGAFVTR
jgi:hypothetical protein